MVAAQQVLDSLKQIGLNLYERKLWVSLLFKGSATAGELSSLAKVPHSRTYDVLESLAEKGFVLVQNTKPIKYAAIQPADALERAKKKIKEDADINADRIDNLKNSAIMKELEKTFKQGTDLIELTDITGSLKGRHAMHNQLEDLFKNAKKKISIMTSGAGLREIHEKHSEILKKAAKKGVKIRVLTPGSKEADEVMGEIKSFAEVKKMKSASSGRFCLIDGSHIVLALTDDKKTHPTQDLALWSQSEHVASDVLEPMFEAMWSQS